MPPERQCYCQDADPNSPYPPGYDGCTPRRRAAAPPRSEPASTPMFTPQERQQLVTDLKTQATAWTQAQAILRQQLAGSPIVAAISAPQPAPSRAQAAARRGAAGRSLPPATRPRLAIESGPSANFRLADQTLNLQNTDQP